MFVPFRSLCDMKLTLIDLRHVLYGKVEQFMDFWNTNEYQY